MVDLVKGGSESFRTEITPRCCEGGGRKEVWDANTFNTKIGRRGVLKGRKVLSRETFTLGMVPQFTPFTAHTIDTV